MLVLLLGLLALAGDLGGLLPPSLADRPVVGLHLAEADSRFAVLRFVCARPVSAELEERVSTRIAGIPGACVSVSDFRSVVGLGAAGLP